MPPKTAKAAKKRTRSPNGSAKRAANRLGLPEISTLSSEDAQALFSTMTSIGLRAGVRARLGKSYGGARDLYEELGWDLNPTTESYRAKYEREPIASAVIDKPVEESWRRPPEVLEVVTDRAQGSTTKFEDAWNEIATALQIYEVFARADRLAGIGEYSVLLLGLRDGAISLDQPASTAHELLYVTPFSQGNAPIASSVGEIQDPRFGMPEFYNLQMSEAGTASKIASTQKAHWSRTVHIVEDLLEGRVMGRPRLRVLLNRLQDLETVVGGSAEMFWRGAFPGLAANMDPEATPEGQSLEDLKSEFEDYVHGLRRYLRTQGVDVKSLAPQVASPKDHADVMLDQIAAVWGPKRILLGSERGELASSADERFWNAKMEARQKKHCEPHIVRPFINSLIMVKLLPAPPLGFTLNWPDIRVKDEKDEAEIAKIQAETLKIYMDSNVMEIFPPEIFFETIMRMDKEELERLQATISLQAGDANADEGTGTGEEDPDD